MATFANIEDPDEIAEVKTIFRDRNTSNLEILTCDPLRYIMDNPILIVSIGMGESIRIQRVIQVATRNIYSFPLMLVITFANSLDSDQARYRSKLFDTLDAIPESNFWKRLLKKISKITHHA